ncbi:MAG: SelB C-terminal domain-containing protein, partial [Actinomycetota bacterium]
RLHRREGASRADLPELLLAERGAVREADLRPLTGLDRAHGAEPTGHWWVAEPVRGSVRPALVDYLRAFHESTPAAEGADAAEVRRAVLDALRKAGAPAVHDLADALVNEAVAEGELVRAGRRIRLAAHRAGIADAEVDRLVTAVAGGEPTPPTIAELRDAGFPRETLEAALRSGALVRIAPDLVLTAGFVGRAVEMVRESGAAGVTVSAMRERLGTSRKYAVPLMEHLDRTGATRRSGDLRFARGT